MPYICIANQINRFMKHTMILLIAMLMSFGTSTFAGTKTSQKVSVGGTKIEIPANLIIKQTITFNDGKVITVYYEKQGGVCKLYSKADLNKYTGADLNRVKSTNFEITDHTEGKCVMTKSTSDVMGLAQSIFKQLG